MSSTGATPTDGYSMGYSQEMHRLMAERNVAEFADHLLPHLRPGMRLLDCGCGPGTITLGLAAVVTPGEVVGLDIAPVQIERAAALAAEQGVGNARFETGDVYALPSSMHTMAATRAMPGIFADYCAKPASPGLNATLAHCPGVRWIACARMRATMPKRCACSARR